MTLRRRVLLALALGAVVAVPAAAAARAHAARRATELEVLLPRIDQALRRVQSRELRSDRDAPWAVLHGVVAYGQELEVYDAAAGRRVNGIDWLLNHATLDGRRIFREEGGRLHLPQGDLNRLVETHPDQYLAVLADAGVPLDREITTDTGRRLRVADLLETSRREVDPDRELGWTLASLARYTALDQPWTADGGREVRAEDLMAHAIRRDPRLEACLGTHHLNGVTRALARHVAAGGAVDGVWKRADDYLRNYVDQARAFQLPTGEFSAAGFRGAAPAATPNGMVYATGHVLEWLTVALPPEELRQPWARAAARRLADVLLRYPPDAFDDGALYHGASALRRYRHAVAAS
jgi:hypothetical protein